MKALIADRALLGQGWSRAGRLVPIPKCSVVGRVKRAIGGVLGTQLFKSDAGFVGDKGQIMLECFGVRSVI